MSKENVEIVRARIAAWNAGDMEAIHESSDPGIIVRLPEGWPEPGPFVGREAVIRQFKQLRETFDADSAELIGDFIDVGDRVAVRLRWRTAGHGPEMKPEWTVIFTVRKRKVLSVDYFWDHAEALEALGLSGHDRNIEIVRRGYEMLDRGDIDSALELLAPDFELDLSTLYPDAPVLRGSAEILSFRDSGPWGHSVHLEPEHFFEVDAERALVFVRVTAKGQGSGVLLDPDVIVRYPRGWPEPGPFVGREAVMHQFEQTREAWDTDFWEQIGDPVDVGDRVVGRLIWHGLGHGPEAKIEATFVTTYRKGKIFLVEGFWDHAEALDVLQD